MVENGIVRIEGVAASWHALLQVFELILVKSRNIAGPEAECKF